MRRRVHAALLAAAAALLLAPPAGAARYNDPPSYRGPSRAPATQPQQPPPAVALSETGVFPDVLVDEAGTAHIVWNEGRGDQDDAASYCRLKRGATECEARAELVWTKTYGAGDGPQFNIDNDGPRIVRIGSQLAVFSKRYPTVADKPDGASSSTVVVWTSNDGGTTWNSDPAIVGKRNLGAMTVFGPLDDPTVLNLAHDPFCSKGEAGMCLTAYKSGQYSAADGEIATGPNQSYSPTLALDGQNPVAGFAGLDGNLHLRRYRSGPVLEESSWSDPHVLRGEEPSLAGGPSGVHMLSRPGFGEAFQVRRVDTQADGGVAAAEPRTLSDGVGRFGRLAQDPAGRLNAVWSQDDGVQMSSAPTGGAFGAPFVLADGSDNGQMDLDATDDGGGFMLVNRTGGVNSPGRIAAVGFGPSSPTGRLGLGDLPGGSAAARTCQVVPFGRFEIESAAGCFLNGAGASRNVVVTKQEVNIQGLRIVPDPGTDLVIDPSALRLDTVGGNARVIASSGGLEVVLWHGPIHRDMSRAVPGSNLFEFPAGEFKANVLGFEVDANTLVKLDRDGVRIPLELELPAGFGGFSGKAELIVKQGRGLILDSLDVHAGPIPIGALVVESIDVSYRRAEDRWEGSGRLTIVGGGTLEASVVFTGGDLTSASFDYEPPQPFVIGPFVYLLSVGGGFETDPVSINARAAIGAGAAVAGEAPVKVNGRFAMTFPRGAPAHFRLDGDVSILFVQVADGFLDFYTNGYAKFGGHYGVDAGAIVFDARLDGSVDARSGQFHAGLNGKVEVCFPTCEGVGGDVVISNVGFAACADFGLFTAGLKFPWEDFNPAILVNPVAAAVAAAIHVRAPCSTSGYRPPAGGMRKAQNGGVGVSVPGGLPTATLLVEGEGGAPRVRVTGPGGETVGSGEPGSAGVVAEPRGVNAAYAILRRPAAGVWTVTPLDGSPAIKRVLVSEGYRQASVSARLGGKGARRTVSYTTRNLTSGQSLRFAERGEFGTRFLTGSTTKSRGTVRFTPADARGRKRTVFALLESEGIVVDEVKVGSFTAPPESRPAAPSRVRAKRKNTTVSVTWRPGRGAKQQIVRVRGKNTNIARLVSAKTRKLTLAAVRRDERVSVEVQGVSSRGIQGKATRLRLRALR